MNRTQIADRASDRQPGGGGADPPSTRRQPAPDRLEISTNAVRAVGYIRVSTDEQVESGLGLAAQTAAITAEATRHGWQLVAVERDAASGKSLARRPALARALGYLERHEAEHLIVAKLDRLSRSVADTGALLDRFSRQRWGLVILDLGVDTSTITGEAMAGVMSVFAQMERKRIGERTRDALRAAARAGVKLGRPRTIPRGTESRMRRRREAGWTIRRIAEAEGLAVSSVQRVLDRT